MKHKRLWTSLALVAVGVALGGGAWHVHQQKVAAANYVNNKTTTFFFHGWCPKIRPKCKDVSVHSSPFLRISGY